MIKIKENLNDWSATIAGLLVAIGTAYSTIDWTNFNIKKEWPRLLISAAIAIGGYISKFKTNGEDKR